MKKYMLFCYADYYPSGGMGDFKGSYTTLSGAIRASKKHAGDNREIHDRDTLKPVWHNLVGRIGVRKK